DELWKIPGARVQYGWGCAGLPHPHSAGFTFSSPDKRRERIGLSRGHVEVRTFVTAGFLDDLLRHGRAASATPCLPATRPAGGPRRRTPPAPPGGAGGKPTTSGGWRRTSSCSFHRRILPGPSPAATRGRAPPPAGGRSANPPAAP